MTKSNVILEKTTLLESNIFQSDEKIKFDFFYFDKKYYLNVYFFVKRENSHDIKNLFFRLEKERKKSLQFEKIQISRITDAFNLIELLLELNAFEKVYNSQDYDFANYLEAKFLLLK